MGNLSRHFFSEIDFRTFGNPYHVGLADGMGTAGSTQVGHALREPLDYWNKRFADAGAVDRELAAF